MTSFGPPGDQPPPTPGPGYGPPSGGPAKFDAKSVSPLDWGVLAAAVLAFIFSFFGYYTAKADRAELAKQTGTSLTQINQQCSNLDQYPGTVRTAVDAACNGTTGSAWHGFFGWFGVLLALVGAALVAIALFAAHVKLPVPARLGAVGAFALAVVSTLLALFVTPNPADNSAGGLNADAIVDVGHGFSYWVVLVLLVVGLVLAFLRFQQTGAQLTVSGASAQGGSVLGRLPAAGPAVRLRNSG